MRERIIQVLASGFGAGKVPVAPGTFGSLVGVVYWFGLQHLRPSAYWMLTIVVIGVAVWICGAAERIGQQKDPAWVVLDELAVMPVALAGLGGEWWWVLTGFALFRLFDITKPPPIRHLQLLPGGWGIVADDVTAAMFACAGGHGVKWLVGRSGGG
jgi:phosphatidylglycerophosphatase A